ncbi:radical SAM protein [candidate division CSSED10-310 bacterium]|uniref:Radical SAM protein n=1 Tax=candidate division CSSED10-310 bacterium TaxID=2855610 RepID=A0ABV6Z477_UNCC1
MDCTQTEWLSDIEYFKNFQTKCIQEHIPLYGSVDLTQRCNLNCVHCYHGKQNRPLPEHDRELTTRQWQLILDEICEAGCLFLLITGGEPLLRDDFAAIYKHARNNGLIINVFSNGSSMTDDIVTLFNDFPPQAVEITLYGATARTYESITQVKNSFDRCMEGIHKLLSTDIRLRLKSVHLTLNDHELYEVAEFAARNGVPFRTDAAIFPCFNGDQSPLQYRVSPELAIDKELSFIPKWLQFQVSRFQKGDIPVTDKLYACGAGLASFHIDAYGNLQACLMAQDIQYNLLSGNFVTGWNEVIPSIRKLKVLPGCACNGCQKKVLCGYCPPFLQLENPGSNKHSNYLCSLAQLRYEALVNKTEA